MYFQNFLFFKSIKSNRAAVGAYAGGNVHTASLLQHQLSEPVINQTNNDYSERYQRPSKQLPLPNQYTFQSFIQNNKITFDNPEDVIYAYYGILKEASNMSGYSGGCGTIGNADLPYPYAYELFMPETRN